MRTGYDSTLARTDRVPTQRNRMAATATVLTAACLVAVATVPACSKGDNSAAARPRRTTTTERESTTTTLSAEEAEKQAVIDAYNAAVQAQTDSSAPPNPDPEFPGIAETHTGLMLDYMVASVTGLQSGGTAFRYPEGSQFRVDVDSADFSTVEGQEVAYLEVCTLDDSEEIVLATGNPISSGVFTIQSTVAMKKVDGVWKLAERRENVRSEGAVGCAVD